MSRPARAGDIGERAVAVVAIEAQRRTLAFVARPIHAVDEQDVLPSVSVVVDERAAGAHRLGQEFAAIGAVAVLEFRPAAVGDVNELKPGVAGACARAATSGAAAPRAGDGAADEVATVHSGAHEAVFERVDHQFGGLVDTELSMMLARCTLTVLTLRSSLAAMARFECPDKSAAAPRVRAG